jgi:ABC-type sulfate transport system permease component
MGAGVSDDDTDDGTSALSSTGQAAIACLVIYTVVCIPLAFWVHRWRAPIQGR